MFMLPFKIDVSNEIPRFRAETFWTKEPETIQWINNNLRSDSNVRLFIDVGANIGIYTLYAASVSANVEILAAEPITKTFPVELNFESGMTIAQYLVEVLRRPAGKHV